MRFSKLYKFYTFYKNATARRPFLVDAVQSATLMGISDSICQTMIEKKPLRNFDCKRTFRFACIGFFFCGPVLRLWFGELHNRLKIDKYHMQSEHYTKKTVALKKVFLDQVIFAPIYILTILCIVGFSQSKPWSQIKKDIKESFLDILQMNYCIWPFVQLFNFYFIPIENQVLLGCVVCVCWDTYLSWKVNQPSPNAVPKADVTEKREDDYEELITPTDEKEEDSLPQNESVYTDKDKGDFQSENELVNIFTNQSKEDIVLENESENTTEQNDSLPEIKMENSTEENESLDLESQSEYETVNITEENEEDSSSENENTTEKQEESLLENELVITTET